MKVKLFFVVVVFLTVLSGCASGPINPLPVVQDKANAAKVTVFRTADIFSDTIKLTFDNRELYAMRKNQYVTFPVNAGYHTIGVKSFGGFIPVENCRSIKVYFAPKKSYYFLIFPTEQVAHIKQIGITEAKNRIKQSHLITNRSIF